MRFWDSYAILPLLVHESKHVRMVELLEQEKPLDDKYKNHPLLGVWKDYQECHIAPNWLLVYRIDGDTITFARTGSHSDIFQKF